MGLIEQTGNFGNRSGFAGVEMAKNSERYKTEVQTYKSKLEGLNIKLQTFFETLIDKARKSFRLAKTGYICTILFLTIALILGFVLVIIMFNIAKN